MPPTTGCLCTGWCGGVTQARSQSSALGAVEGCGPGCCTVGPCWAQTRELGRQAAYKPGKRFPAVGSPSLQAQRGLVLYY